MEDWWSCRRTVHQPVKHPANPLINIRLHFWLKKAELYSFWFV